MQVVRGEFAGACYGVQRALDMVLALLDETCEVHTLGPLIHNPQVVASLEAKGARVADSVADVTGGTVVIRSHGVTPEVRAQLDAAGLCVVDATCPHVARAQAAAQKLAQSGHHVIVVGEPGHPEVLSLKAYAKSAGARVDVCESAQDLPEHLGQSVGVVVQTTQMKKTLDEVVCALRARGREPEVKNTICSATTKRQIAAAELAQRAGAMVVIGGKNSSNTTRLAEICKMHCPNTVHIESASEINAADYSQFDLVGVTAGASTPDNQIQEVLAALGAAATSRC
jgi:4-hydroxy-3-methylbut-2-enyl diphosphate reductase